MTGERTIVIPKKALLWGLLLIVVFIAVVLGAPLLKSSTPNDSGDPSDTAAATAADGTLSASSDLEQQDVDMDAALEAAGEVLSQVMWFDHTEGREIWVQRIDPLCTPNGMALYNGPFFADQVWPTMMEREYVTQDIEVLSTQIVGEGPMPSTVIVEVILQIEYALGKDDPIQTETTNEIVMLYHDGQWLTEGPPFPPSGTSVPTD